MQKRHLETADMYEPPLDVFGADAVDRWFTEQEITNIIEIVRRLEV
jgi:type I restriction enzyme, R subunit